MSSTIPYDVSSRLAAVSVAPTAYAPPAAMRTTPRAPALATLIAVSTPASTTFFAASQAEPRNSSAPPSIDPLSSSPMASNLSRQSRLAAANPPDPVACPFNNRQSTNQHLATVSGLGRSRARIGSCETQAQVH